MKHIYKYTIDVGDNVIQMPEGAEVLSAHAQYGSACIWAMVDTSRPSVPRAFTAFMTGQSIPDPQFGDPLVDKKFVGTVLIDGGDFVLHVFEIVGRG